MANGKPNTRVYEEIILRCGLPMHSSDIAIEAKRYGVIFKGQHRSESLLVYQSMLNSKHFENLGSNHWWVVGFPPRVTGRGRTRRN